MHLPKQKNEGQIRKNTGRKKKRRQADLGLRSIFGHHRRSHQRQEDLKRCYSSGKKPICYVLSAIYVLYPAAEWSFSVLSKRKE